MTAAERKLCTCLDEPAYKCPVHKREHTLGHAIAVRTDADGEQLVDVLVPDTEPVFRADSPADVVERLKREAAERANKTRAEAFADHCAAIARLAFAVKALNYGEPCTASILALVDDARQALGIIAANAELLGRK